MYIRMINKKARWIEDRNKDINKLSSDIITNCLKTSSDTLSLWYLDDDTEIDDAIIALSSNRELLQRLDYVIIPDEYIERYSLVLAKKPGNSPYENFNKKHWDIININYSSLGIIASMILDIINNGGGEIVRVPAGKVEKNLISAIKEGKLNKTVMSPQLLEKIS